MNILNEFIGEFNKDKLYTVIGIGLVLSPSIVFMNLIYTLLFPRFSASDTSGISADVAFLVVSLFVSVICAPILEELTYRGLMLVFIKLTKRPYLIIIISSVIFGLMHDGTFGTFQATIAGFILGFIAYTYGIAFSIILHLITNSLSLFNGFLISSIQSSIIFLLLIIEIVVGIIIFIKHNNQLFNSLDVTFVSSIIERIKEWLKNNRR